MKDFHEYAMRFYDPALRHARRVNREEFAEVAVRAADAYDRSRSVEGSQRIAEDAAAITAHSNEVYEAVLALDDIHQALLDLIDEYDADVIAQTWSRIRRLASEGTAEGA